MFCDAAKNTPSEFGVVVKRKLVVGPAFASEQLG